MGRAELGKVALAGAGSSSSGAGAGAGLGFGTVLTSKSRLTCTVVTVLARAAAVQCDVRDPAASPRPGTGAQPIHAAVFSHSVPPRRSLAARISNTEEHGAAPRGQAKRVAVHPTTRSVGVLPTALSPDPKMSPASRSPSSARVTQTTEGAGSEDPTRKDAVAESPDPDTPALVAVLAPQSPPFLFAQPRKPPMPDLAGVWIDLATRDDGHALEYWIEGRLERRAVAGRGTPRAEAPPTASSTRPVRCMCWTFCPWRGGGRPRSTCGAWRRMCSGRCHSRRPSWRGALHRCPSIWRAQVGEADQEPTQE